MRARLLLIVVALTGCSRATYREWADREAYPILGERVVSPAFDIGRTQVEPAPGSRIADPFDPDHPPKPPDDYSAALFMQRPGGMRGSSHWNKDGCTDQIEGPSWLECLAPGPDGVVKLTQDKAVEIALLNSREYQSALEGVYLSALALTLNRFEFDVRWFGRNATTFTHTGAGGPPIETDALSVTTNLGFNRTFAAGGQLLADLSNALVFEYANGSTAVKSNLVFTFTQPLLRNAGRKVRLESLTQGERDVLYAVRDFARFRKQFWAATAVQSGGYLDLLLAVQSIRNAQENLKLQEESFRLVEELLRGGRASAVEYDTVYRGVLSARQSVLNAEVGLQSSLDSYKLRLGLPPRLPIALDDALLSQFVLTDAESETLREDLDKFQRDRLKEIDDVPTAEGIGKLFASLKSLADRMPDALARTNADLAKWSPHLDRPPQPGEDADLRNRTRAAYENLIKSMAESASDLTATKAAIERHRTAVTEASRKASWEAMTADLKMLTIVLDAVIGAQTQARIYRIELPVVETDEATGLALAAGNRLDLMNQLGAVTDAWRKVTVAANALRGDAAIVATANLGTDPDHTRPFNFAAQASSYTVGLQIDGPLNRLAERNAYRASLIQYQRAKRAYINLSDQIEFQIRNDLRQLTRLRVSFELARQSVISSARQFENTRLQLLGVRDRQQANQSTTVLLQNALNDLLGARNALAAAFINFEQQRIQLLLDLEVLQLDQRGFPTNVSRPLPPAGAPPGPDNAAPAPRPADQRKAGP